MHLELWNRGARTSVELPEGRVTLGDGADDLIQLEGLGARQLTLVKEGRQVTMVSRRTLSVSGVFFPAHVARWLLVGEALELEEDLSLCLHALPALTTSLVLQQLLTGEEVPPPEAGPALLCLAGKDRGRHLALDAPVVEVGRAWGAQARLNDPSVSRRHARITARGESYCLEDLGGPNGVFVNGVRLQAPFALSNGDLIEVGHTLLRAWLPPDESV